MRIVTVLLLFVASASSGFGQSGPTPYPYEVHLPDVQAIEAPDGFALILFLHGAGGLIPADNPIPDFASGQPGFPFLVVTPITDQPWEVGRLDAVLTEVSERFTIDASRIYVTGLSMGAVGAWELAAAFPDRFRALALVAGRLSPSHACRLQHIPVWLFHNRADEIVPVDDSLHLAEALERCGAREVLVTIYDELEPGLWHHNAWKAAYTDPELYDWFLTR